METPTLLYDWHWAQPAPRAVVLLVHGAGEHCGRYTWVAEQLNQQGLAVLGTDLPGLGQSGGRRGHIESFERYLDVVDRLWQRATALYPGLPVVLLGHSMGGLITVRWLQTRSTHDPLAAVVLSSPCLDLCLPVPPFKANLARWLNRIWPTLSQPNGIASSDVSRAPDTINHYTTDPLIVRNVSVRWFSELSAAMRKATASASTFPAPTLILQAGSDRLVSAPATRSFSDRLSAPNKHFHLYESLFHELLNEPEREQVFQDLMAWLNTVLPVAASASDLSSSAGESPDDFQAQRAHSSGGFSS